MTPSSRRSENTAGQYRNVFTAIRSRRQNLARSSGKVAEVVAILPGSSLSGRASFSGSYAARFLVVAAIAIARPAYRRKSWYRFETTLECASLSLSIPPSLSFFLSLILSSPLFLVAELACLSSVIDFPRRQADGEEKDCPRGAWIELLTIGLLCRGAFQPAAGRFKASVDSRRGIADATHTSEYNNITRRVI